MKPTGYFRARKSRRTRYGMPSLDFNETQGNSSAGELALRVLLSLRRASGNRSFPARTAFRGNREEAVIVEKR
jgi:hypothetical protein